METVTKIAIGGLLHDFGKLLFRCGDGRSHAESGYAFLREQAHLTDQDILAQIRYHHAAGIKNASIPPDSLAYITYIADNIASAADRRKSDEEGRGFVRDLALESIFNRLNENDQMFHYEPGALRDAVRYPQKGMITYGMDFYNECVDRIRDAVKGIEFSESYVNSLLEILESCVSYIPSSTSKEEVADISLYDHSKLTAALGCCILLYLMENGQQDYRERLYQRAPEFYGEKVFLLYSMDISGIQDFIYTISSDKALKTLRARSFYLDILMEHLVDTALSKVGLSRANCIYCGGGHAYLLLPNTERAKLQIEDFETMANGWFMDWFGTALYVAGGYAPCSADDLKNEPEGTYAQIFRKISNSISERKLKRYSAQQIVQINQRSHSQALRECAVCRRTDHLGEDDRCAICSGIERFSKAVQTKEFFAVTTTRDKEQILPLPGDAYLIAEDVEGLRRRIKDDDGYLRCYCKNSAYTGRGLATHLWVGDYENGGDFHELASGAEGIRRLAVLRADVDDLGQAFVGGFASEKYGQRYVTLSRTATFSRQLALFFKGHINELLKQGTYFLTNQDMPARQVTVVYAGGDDLFIIGAWNDILGFAVDLNDALAEFTQETLTLSAGIGLYPEKYPVAAMARQTGMLEEASKSHPGKNAVTLFDASNTFSWDDFVNGVLEEKFQLIQAFFQAVPSDRVTSRYGKSFLYRLLGLMRERGEKINLARYAYLLARMEPRESDDENYKALYGTFSQKMYHWMKDEGQCRQAMLAIMIYIYTIREQTEGENDEN